MGVLDDLFDSLFGIHIIEPLIVNDRRLVVKPENLTTTFKKPKQPRYLQIYDRYQFQGQPEVKNPRNNKREIGLSFQSGSTTDDKLKRQRNSVSSLTQFTNTKPVTRGVSVDPGIKLEDRKIRMPPIPM